MLDKLRTIDKKIIIGIGAFFLLIIVVLAVMLFNKITNVEYEYPNQLLEGVEYLNGKFRYTYKNNGWAVKLDDLASTDPVIKPYLCTTVNDTPVNDMSSMFKSSNASSIDLRGIDTSNVEKMSSMFANAKATSINLNGLDTSKVTDMSWMFHICSATSIDLSGLDTSKVTNMSWMFYNVPASTIDISSFSTEASPKVCYMFSSSNINTIYASDRWNKNNILLGYQYCGSNTIFSNGIVGGNNTPYNSSNDEKEYACIDTPQTPGYFTQKTN